MPLRSDMEIIDYIKVFTRRKWVIIISFLSVFLGAGVYIFMATKIYKSTTTILVVPQRVSENYIRSTVMVGAEGRLATLQQQVTSKTRLLKVITELGLYQKELKDTPLEEIIERMTKAIEIEIVQERRPDRFRDDAVAFSISFEHEDPKMAMLTASKLASTYIEENVKSREHQAVGTSELLDSQLRVTKARLETQENKVNQYKKQYMGSLPQEMQANLNALIRLQLQSSTIANEIRDAENQKLQLQTQLNLIVKGPQAIVHEDGREEVDSAEGAAQVLATQLTLRRGQLAEISAKYSDKYPDVIRLRKEIGQLEKQLADTRSSSSSGTGKEGPNKTSVYMPLTGKEREEFYRIKDQLAGIEAEIKARKTERGNIQEKIAEAQGRVDQAPMHEQDLIFLTRDYENLKRSYDDLLRKKMEADLSQQMETRQKGEQYQILDPANLPEKPFKPKPKVVLAIALLMACTLGFGGSIVMERMDLSLREVSDIKQYFDLPVLACIPILESNEMDRKRKFRWKAVWAGVILFALLFLGFLFLVRDKIGGFLNT